MSHKLCLLSTVEVRNILASLLKFQKITASGVNARSEAHTLVYSYDGDWRLKEANQYAGTNTSSTPTRMDAFLYDEVANRTKSTVTTTATVDTFFGYNAGNQLISHQVGTGTPVSISYDDAGRMLSDGATSFT